MRRNNIFMWAYISFVFFAILMRLLFDYVLWTPLVIAITFSSILFSLEDLFVTLEKAIKDSCDIAEAFSDNAYENLDNRLSLFDKIDERAKRYRDTQNDMSTIQDSFRPVIANTEELMQILKDLLHEVQTKRSKQKQYQIIADILAYFGFIILFCALIFSSFVAIPTIVQEIITVLSFSIILMTNQVKTNLSEKIKKEIIYSQKALKAQKKSRDFFSRWEQELDYLTELIELPAMETEEPTHAD